MTAAAIPTPLRELFAGIVDYAGLFPPAACSMADAVRQYAEYRRSPQRWMLGKLIVPAGRLGELAAAAEPVINAGDEPWRLSVTLDADPDRGVDAIESFASGRSGRLVADAVEAKVASPHDVERLRGAVPAPLACYCEVPSRGPYRDIVGTIAGCGAHPKIRTGGVRREAFPAVADVVDFISAAVASRVPFKATAGLHHPFREVYPLTYAPDAERGVMYGFVNLLAAVAVIRERNDPASAAAILESAAGEFRWADGDLLWRATTISRGDLARAHAAAFTSFGSCSFREPVDELEASLTR